MSDMTMEFEKRETSEILPAGFGDLTGKEAMPVLKRAAGRIEIVQSKSTFRDGLVETFEGLAGWIEGNRAKLTKATLKAITGATFIAVATAACSPQVVGPVIAVPDGDKWPTVTQPATATETQNPTGTPTTPATQEASPTPEAKDVWVYSKDGRIYYNEKELGDGLFAINEANTESYYESMMAGLWNFNRAVYDETVNFRIDEATTAQAKRFMKLFPTEQSFLDYVKANKGKVTLYIPINHNTLGEPYMPTIQLVEGVDLSALAIGVQVQDPKDIKDYYNSTDYVNSPYFEYEGNEGKFLMETTKTSDGRLILRITVGKDLKYKSDGTINYQPNTVGKKYGVLPLEKGMDSQTALKSVNQVILYIPEALKDSKLYGPYKGVIIRVKMPFEFDKEWFDAAQNSPDSPFIIR